MTPWYRKPARPWQFWLPRSGMAGGILLGLLFGMLLGLIQYLCTL